MKGARMIGFSMFHGGLVVFNAWAASRGSYGNAALAVVALALSAFYLAGFLSERRKP